jgi:hypothetical protein
MDSTVRTVILYQFTNNDNVQMEKQILLLQVFRFAVGRCYSNCHLNPNSVTLNMEAAYFCKMSEQMHYTTRCKNPEDTHGTMRKMTGEIMKFLVT